MLLSLLAISSLLSQVMFNGSDFWLTHWANLVEEARAIDGKELEPHVVR